MTIEQKRNLETWIAALRSGKYTQTRGILHRVTPTAICPAGHCCLGVANECIGINGDNIYSGEYFSEMFGLPDIVDKLVTMNDYDGQTFKQIADYLETFLKD